jgi:hypothetical protein
MNPPAAGFFLPVPGLIKSIEQTKYENVYLGANKRIIYLYFVIDNG